MGLPKARKNKGKKLTIIDNESSWDYLDKDEVVEPEEKSNKKDNILDKLKDSDSDISESMKSHFKEVNPNKIINKSEGRIPIKDWVIAYKAMNEIFFELFGDTLPKITDKTVIKKIGYLKLISKELRENEVNVKEFFIWLCRSWGEMIAPKGYLSWITDLHNQSFVNLKYISNSELIAGLIEKYKTRELKSRRDIIIKYREYNHQKELYMKNELVKMVCNDDELTNQIFKNILDTNQKLLPNIYREYPDSIFKYPLVVINILSKYPVYYMRVDVNIDNDSAFNSLSGLQKVKILKRVKLNTSTLDLSKIDISKYIPTSKEIKDEIRLVENKIELYKQELIGN